jgi:hypothetical protein
MLPAASNSSKTDGLKFTLMKRSRDGGIKGQAGSTPWLTSVENSLRMRQPQGEQRKEAKKN